MIKQRDSAQRFAVKMPNVGKIGYTFISDDGDKLRMWVFLSEGSDMLKRPITSRNPAVKVQS